MAFRADRLCVLPRQLEIEVDMAEIISISIHAIVASETVCPEGQEMSLGEGNIHLTVAGLAGVQCEGCDVAQMTIIAHERVTLCSKLVSV
jgi:hypothetical protein